MNVILYPQKNNSAEEEFYIGYLPAAPSGLARRIRSIVLILTLGVAALAFLAAFSQNPIDKGRFEFGILRTFEGVFYADPVPRLRMSLPEGKNPSSDAVTYLLVGAGKAGIPDEVRSHDGEKIRFNGSLIERENMLMIEMNDLSSLEVLGEPSSEESRNTTETLGKVTLTGEIVDTKCYFGVMRPATGKVHRACAIRCLEGGVPPGLLVRDEEGNGVVFMLAAPEGGTFDFDPQWAAIEVRVKGLLELENNVPILRVERMEMTAALDQNKPLFSVDPMESKESAQP